MTTPDDQTGTRTTPIPYRWALHRCYPQAVIDLVADRCSSKVFSHYPCHGHVVPKNDLIEAEIRKTPAQYLWAHRRFKTRPSGELPVYKRRS